MCICMSVWSSLCVSACLYVLHCLVIPGGFPRSRLTGSSGVKSFLFKLFLPGILSRKAEYNMLINVRYLSEIRTTLTVAFNPVPAVLLANDVAPRDI